MHRFHQLDVFSSVLGLGNPLAVVHDADSLTTEEMARFARWTNLSETAFLLTPTDERADYRVRIFTPGRELPFAGHPTLGSARAWVIGGGAARNGALVQECGAGLVRVRQNGTAFAFEAPALVRNGPVEAGIRSRVVAALGVKHAAVRAIEHIDNGPGWIGVLLESADAVLSIEPDFAGVDDLHIGVLGAAAPEHPADFEMRAFAPAIGVAEDPVTGSLAAGFARWLIPSAQAPPRFTIRQGTRLQRNGTIRIDLEDDVVWVGGDTVVGVSGEVALP